MQETTRLLDALKARFKAIGMTYRDIGLAMKLSEATVKRTFSARTLTLARLEALCELAGLSVADLARLAGGGANLTRITREQESALVAQPALLLVFYLLANDYTFQKLRTDFVFAEPELIGHLAQLDRLGLIQLLPNNRIRLRVSKTVEWLPDGPVRAFFHTNVREEFFQHGFYEPQSGLKFVSANLCAASIERLLRRMDQWVQAFDEIAKLDAQFPASAERTGVSLLIASRAWHYSLFDQYRRSPLSVSPTLGLRVGK